MSQINPKYVDTTETFDDFLQEIGMYEEVVALAQKKIVAMELLEAMKKQHMSKVEMAQRMKTSRSSVDRLLNPNHYNVTIDTISRAATALGLHLNISLS